MAYDLRRESWIPFRRKSRKVVWGAPSLLTEDLGGGDPIVALAAPRADFNAALTEFLIGLMTAALAPDDEDAWLEQWASPPSPAEIQSALNRLPDAFNLLGNGPRFLQDITTADFQDKLKPIEALLIDAVGEQGKERNTDLFVKRNRVTVLGRPAAAMALLTLQTFAPAGGQGNRTSMRGGGPLTTLVEPRVQTQGESLAHEQPLWRKIWANAPTTDQFDNLQARSYSPAETFPWLAKTRTSNEKQGGRPTTPQDGHPLQAFFGMPRRIRLSAEARDGHCGLTNHADSVLVTGFHAVNYGVQYQAWRHPLSPYYRDAKGHLLPRHPQPGGLAWTDWAGLLLRDPSSDGKNSPATCVTRFAARRADGIHVRKFRLEATGYDADNMKARGWMQAEMPAFALPSKRIGAVWRVCESVTKAADITADATEWAVKCALFDKPKDAKGDFSIVQRSVWDATQAEFFGVVERAAAEDAPDELETLLAQAFVVPLRNAAFAAFSATCPTDGIEHLSMRRLVGARYRLAGVFSGHGKHGNALFDALKLPKPEASSQTAKTKKKGLAA